MSSITITQGLKLNARERNLIIKARQRRGWLPRDLAAKCGVTREMIVMVENGTGNPSPKVLQSIAKALGLRLTIEASMTLEAV